MKKKIILIIFFTVLIVPFILYYLGGITIGNNFDYNINNKYSHILEEYSYDDYYYKIIYTFKNEKCISIRGITKYSDESSAKKYYNELLNSTSFDNIEINDLIVKYNRTDYDSILFNNIINKLQQKEKVNIVIF